MIKLALIGYPLSHSISASLHKAAMVSTGLEGTYEILETEPFDLVTRVKQLKSGEYTGFNVTIPLKVPITLFLEQFDEYANLAGAANTVKVLDDKSLYGYNTDIYGFLNAMTPDFKKTLEGKPVAVLGTGGAARAVAIALSELKVAQIDLYSRNILNARDTAEFLREKFPSIKINLMQINHLNDLSSTAMLVNTTPMGMKGELKDVSPLDEKVIKTLNNEALVYDIVYNPVKTKLLKIAENCGKKTLGGLDMLIYQAAKAFEIWTGKTPDISAMKIAALESLN